MASTLPNISVADFASQMMEGSIKNISEGREPIPNVNSNSSEVVHMAPDVSHIKVPDTLIESITGRPVKQASDLPSMESNDNEKIKSLLEQTNSVLSNLKKIISEGTTAGSLGNGYYTGDGKDSARARLQSKRYPNSKSYEDIMGDRGYVSYEDILPPEKSGTETHKEGKKVKISNTLESRIEKLMRKSLTEYKGRTESDSAHAICTSQKQKSKGGMDHATWKRCVGHVKGKL